MDSKQGNIMNLKKARQVNKNISFAVSSLLNPLNYLQYRMHKQRKKHVRSQPNRRNSR